MILHGFAWRSAKSTVMISKNCKQMITQACEDFIANPLIEEYEIEISENKQ